jgi:hypothetical protein
VLAGLSAFGIAPPAQDAVPVYEVTTRSITIPVQLNRGQNVRYVALFVSTNEGQTWKLHARIDPLVGQFVFEAPKSGEYWFAAKVVYQDGRADPDDGNLHPQLRVRVTLPEQPRVGTPPPLLVPPQAKPSKEAELDELDDELNRIEMDLIRKEIRRLAASKELTPEVMERIDVLRERLDRLRGNPPVSPPGCMPPYVVPSVPRLSAPDDGPPLSPPGTNPPPPGGPVLLDRGSMILGGYYRRW